MFKKISTFIFSIFLFPTVYAFHFSDMNEFPSWAIDAIEDVDDKDVMTGFGDGSFRPWKELNRAEAVTLLLRSKNIETKDVIPHDFFDDVNRKAWFAKAVTVASEKGWVVGKSSNMFYPADRLNRAEFATIISRAFDLNIEDIEKVPNYRDIPSKAWYTSSVYAMYDNGLIRNPNSLFYYPNKNVTRAEAAWVFSRILNMPRLNGTSKENDFSSNIKRDTKRVAIKPRDFNQYKQGYDIEKKKVKFSVDANSEFINLTRESNDWIDLGSLIIENMLDDKFELNSLKFKFHFDSTSVGPAENFLVKFTNENEDFILEKNVAKTGEVTFTGLSNFVEPTKSKVYTLSIMAKKDGNYYSKSGEAKFNVTEARGVYWSAPKKESSKSNALAKFAPVKFNSRQFSKIKFTP